MLAGDALSEMFRLRVGCTLAVVRVGHFRSRGCQVNDSVGFKGWVKFGEIAIMKRVGSGEAILFFTLFTWENKNRMNSWESHYPLSRQEGIFTNNVSSALNSCIAVFFPCYSFLRWIKIFSIDPSLKNSN